MIELKNKEIFKEVVEYFGTKYIFIDKAPDGLNTDFRVKSVWDLIERYKYIKSNNEIIQKKEGIIKLILNFILDPQTWI